MGIFQATGANRTITQGDRALRLFADRMPERRLFASYLHDDPPRRTLLFFHGDGGNGKSLLLRLLRLRYCRRLPPDSWASVKAITDDKAFAEQYENAADAIAIPCAHLDFASPDRALPVAI